MSVFFVCKLRGQHGPICLFKKETEKNEKDLSLSHVHTQIDGGHNDFRGEGRLFKRKGKGRRRLRKGGEEGEGIRRSQGQEIVWERSHVRVELTRISVGVH